jgi:hypothetical protein
VVEFGEQVLAKLVKPKPQSKLAQKISAKFVEATWVGVDRRTGEHRVVTRTGKALRVRTIKRRPLENRWSKAAVLAVRATPRVPDPDKASAHQDDLDAKATEAEEKMLHADMPKGDVEKPQGADLGTKMRPNRDDESRELRISDRILTKYGYSDGCAGCRAKLHGLLQRKHEPSCRLRIYDAMTADPEEFDNLERAIIRTQGRSIAEGVVIPSESAGAIVCPA